MTSPDNDPDRAASSDPVAGGTEPSAAGYEAPPIEDTSSAPDPALDDTPPQGYTPPPAYNPPDPAPSSSAPNYVPPAGYDPPPAYTPVTGYPPSGDFSNPPYPPPPPGFAPPYPDAGSQPPYPTPGYGAPGYGSPGYGAPGYGAPGYATPGYGAPGYLPPSPYGGGYPGAEYGYGAPPQSGSNSLAIGSLVASLLAIPLNLLCFSGTIASIVAVVLGIVALNQIKKSGQGGKEMAIAGTVIGALGLIGAFILVVLVASA